MAPDPAAMEEAARGDAQFSAKPADSSVNESNNTPEESLDEASFSTAVETMSLADTTSASQATSNPLMNGSSQESSQAAEIRRQVECYFSDENLKRDDFLIKKIHGGDNIPIPLRIICEFQRMQNFQSIKEVGKALKESQTLDVVTYKGRECVVRKVPYKSDKSTKKSKTKPTGFEEYWTDPPMTPAEFAEEAELYDAEHIFAIRIETALQKFKSKRRMNNRRSLIYVRWLKLGGFETGPKQFSGGIDGESLEDKTATEIASITATELVAEDKYETGPNAKYMVDFEGVAKGFLSSYLPVVIDTRDVAAVKESVNVLRNAYNYILHHNVCPEHTEDIFAARTICDLAETQLPKVGRAIKLFPGNFNLACSTLFGGRYKGMYAGDQEWNKDFYDTKKNFKIGMSDKEARHVVAVALASYGNEELFEETATKKEHWELTIVHSEDHVGLEVTALAPATEDIRNFYEDDMGGKLGTLGRLHCKPWDIPSLDSHDLPANYDAPKQPEHYVFLLEQELLDCCFEGMKFEATVNTLSTGIKFIDNVFGVHCSFYVFLENEMVRWWREPRLLTREEQLQRDARGQGDDEDAGPSPEEIG